MQTQHPFGETIDSECLRALEETAQLCESLGHHVETVQHPADYKAATGAMNILVCIHTYQNVKKRLDELSMDLETADLETSTRQMAQMGARFSATDYLRARDTLNAAAAEMQTFHARYDVLLSPVLTKTTARLGWLNMNASDLNEYGSRYRSYSGFTALYNGTGQPSASLPMHSDANGLPVGVMATAAWGGDALLLQFARATGRGPPLAAVCPDRSFRMSLKQNSHDSSRRTNYNKHKIGATLRRRGDRMKNLISQADGKSSLSVIHAACSLLWLLPGALSAQEFQTPTTEWGVPDLQGYWKNNTVMPFERAAGTR